jgi:hypothetical protein
MPKVRGIAPIRWIREIAWIDVLSRLSLLGACIDWYGSEVIRSS